LATIVTILKAGESMKNIAGSGTHETV